MKQNRKERKRKRTRQNIQQTLQMGKTNKQTVANRLCAKQNKNLGENFSSEQT